MNERSGNPEIQNPRHILVVDDDKDFADTLARLLTLDGYKVSRAYNIVDAQTAFDRVPAEIALIDIRLSGRSGLDLVSVMRQRSPEVICIMMTAFSSVQSAIEALQQGAYDYLSKPFYPEQLRAALKRGFERLALAKGRERAEAALRQRNRKLEELNKRLARSEERLRNIIDNSPSSISLKDLEGRYVIVNKRFEEWYGHRQDQVAGKPSSDFFPTDIDRLLNAQWEEVVKKQKVVEEEMEIPFVDGRTHSILTIKFPVFGDTGQPIGVGTIASDITLSKRAEEQLRQAQKTEALGQLTGGIAHDFNNLLVVISGNVDLMRDQLNDDPALTEMIDDVVAAAESGAELTHRLLAFSRRQTLHPQITHAGELITGFCRMLVRTLDETIEIREKPRKELWSVEVDRNQLKTSLLNLAINARDALPDGGVLTIEAANVTSVADDGVRLDGPPQGDYVVISVTDNGTGMTPDVLDSAIEPFFTTKEVGRGSGLGLSMVHGFVNQSGGHMEIASTVGKGTTVSLYLPGLDAEPSAAETQVAAVDENDGSGERILVVEDKADVRRLTARILTRLGYDVLEAADGPTALELMGTAPKIDLLFTDFAMPGGLNGADLAREARSRQAGLKVLYASGHINNSDIQDDLSRNGFGFVRKPFTMDGLAREVRRALQSNPGHGAETRLEAK